MRLAWRVGVAVALLALAPAAALAQSYPIKPLRLVLRAPPGGADDLQGRLIAPALGKALGQQVVIDYRPGAGGLVAWEYIAKSPPDGYTLMLTASGLGAIRSLRPDVSIDPWRDFAWVSQVSSFMLIMVAHPSLPVKTPKELIALAKKRPGQLTYGSTGIGATPHLAAEYFKSTARIDINHVPYKGGGAMFLDLMGGRIELGFSTTAGAVPHVRAGKMKALGVTGATRLADLPEVPTIAEGAGLPGFEFTGYYAIIVPAATPREIVATLAGALAKGMSAPGFREQFTKAVAGMEPVFNTPEQMLQVAKLDAAKVEPIVRAANIRAE
jgi:tripartite-type tricarboxylate transporter receptor subunit TctC